MTKDSIRELHHLLNRAITILHTDQDVPEGLKRKLTAARTELIAHRKATQGE